MNRKNIIIPQGWVAFYDPESKKVTGITEFKSPSKGFTALSILVDETKQGLLAKVAAQGLSYTPPA